ncbi:hemolysin-type calcium-binding protein [Vibrio mimicus VM603]|uniref:Hemolysin-type calcium-binding protein n=1 Tax=Vibrio mimicus VM603 TaxID=671074 RepID=D2YCN2_VIBMI|nr:hypothetical protein [Vibrio mimicus]EEW07483.1 hemolysin-type calcium-binding protein [Vibrio mimicus VM603]
MQNRDVSSIETIVVTADRFPDMGNDKGNDSGSHEQSEVSLLTQVTKLLEGMTPVNAADKMYQLMQILVSVAEAYDIQHNTQIANKLRSLDFIEFVNPYEPESPFVTDKQYAISKVVGGITKAVGLNVAIEIAKELEDSGLDGTKVASAAAIGLLDTFVTIATATTAVLLTGAFISATAPAALIATVTVGALFAGESLSNGPYSKAKDELKNKLDKFLTDLGEGHQSAEGAQFIREISDVFSNGATKIDIISDVSTDLGKYSSLSTKLVDMGEGNGTVFMTSGKEVVNGGKGTDTINYGHEFLSNSGINVNLTTGEASGGIAEGDTLSSSIENLIGSNYSGTIVGNSSNNNLFGGSGSDKIESADGDDLISGGAYLLTSKDAKYITLGGKKYDVSDFDSDIINGGNGNDTIIGGPNDYIIGGSGVDTLVLSEHIFGESTAIQLQNQNNSFRVLQSGSNKVYISDDVEKISILGQDFYKNGVNVGRWSNEFNQKWKVG